MTTNLQLFNKFITLSMKKNIYLLNTYFFLYILFTKFGQIFRYFKRNFIENIHKGSINQISRSFFDDSKFV